MLTWWTSKSIRFGAALALFLLCAPAWAADIAVVVHPGVPFDDVTFAEMRRIMMGDRQYWVPGLRVTLLIRAPVARERDVVLKSIYQMNDAQFKQYWVGKVFRADTASGPKIVYSTDMAVEIAAGVPGSIAFVEATNIPKGLKVLKINGKKPGEKGYPLN